MPLTESGLMSSASPNAMAAIDTSAQNTDRPALLADYWTTDEMAAAAGVCTRTLARWHSLRVGPPRTRLGNKVLYRIVSAKVWLVAQEEADVRGRGRVA